MQNIKSKISTIKTAYKQQTSGELILTEPKEISSAEPLDIFYQLEQITREEIIREVYSKIDPDGSTTWLILKLHHYSLTKGIFFRILIFYNKNLEKFKILLLSIFIFCSLLLSFSLFGYYKQIYVIDLILFVGVLMLYKYLNL